MKFVAALAFAAGAAATYQGAPAPSYTAEAGYSAEAPASSYAAEVSSSAEAGYSQAPAPTSSSAAGYSQSPVASYSASEVVSYTTKVVSSVVTYCPGATTITHGSSTYTVTEATTLTITDCPCTISVPVTTLSSVDCKTCAGPAPSSAPGYNATVPGVPTSYAVPTTVLPTGGAPGYTTGAPAPTTAVPTAAAGKVALSGAGLAGIMAVAAFL